jgi:apolipoprotein N-acyltransferase
VNRAWPAFLEKHAAWLLSGAMLALSFPNAISARFPIWSPFFAYLALWPLLRAAQASRSAWQAWARGFGAGLLFFVASLYWISYVKPMGAAAPVGWIALSAYCALYPALFSALAYWGLTRLPLPLLWLPALWTLLEAGRAWAITGFPWCGLGHSQYNMIFLLPLAAAGGVWALHYFCASIGTGLFLLQSQARKHLQWQALGLALFYALLWFAGQAPPAQGPGIKVALIQGAIDQDQAWTAQYRAALWERYRGLMDKAVSQGAQALIWPEAALPAILSEQGSDVQTLLAWSRGREVDILVGSYDRGPQGQGIQNTVALVRNGKIMAQYAKRHLVPFGEYIPLRGLLPFVEQAVQRFGAGDDFVPGDAPHLLPVQGGSTSPLICYEAIFPELAREAVLSGATWLTVATFDTWYGKSAGPYQHASLAVFRSAELARPLARCGATGVSMFIDAQGRITQSLDLDQIGIVVGQVYPSSYLTPYARWGNWFLWFCGGVLGLVAILKRLHKGF